MSATQLAPCATCGAERTPSNMVSGTPPICPDCFHKELRQTERRQSSPEYREEVHAAAEYRLRHHGGDYDEAAELAEHMAQLAADSYGADSQTARFRRDLASLLRRRAETVKGMRVP